jgi:hypothetical protein
MARSKHTRAAAAADRPTVSPARPTITRDDIARLAYDLYLRRGAANGHDLDDWLRAEHELQHARPLKVA